MRQLRCELGGDMLIRGEEMCTIRCEITSHSSEWALEGSFDLILRIPCFWGHLWVFRDVHISSPQLPGLRNTYPSTIEGSFSANAWYFSYCLIVFLMIPILEKKKKTFLVRREGFKFGFKICLSPISVQADDILPRRGIWNLGFFWSKTHPDSSTGAWQQFRSVLISQCGSALQLSVIPDKGYVIGKVTRWNDCLQLSYVDVNNLWFQSLGVNSVHRLLGNKHSWGTDVQWGSFAQFSNGDCVCESTKNSLFCCGHFAFISRFEVWLFDGCVRNSLRHLWQDIPDGR